MDRYALETGDNWYCKHCGESAGVYIDLRSRLLGDARAIRCTICQTVDSVIAAADLQHLGIEGE